MTEIFDLQRFRRDVGITQKQLSDLLGVPQSFISQVENHKDPMPPTWKDMLATTYNIRNISEYIQVVDNGTTITDVNGVAGIGVCVQNEMTNVLNYLSSRDSMLIDIIKNHDSQLSRAQDQLDKAQSQIDRLISLLEKNK